MTTRLALSLLFAFTATSVPIAVNAQGKTSVADTPAAQLLSGESWEVFCSRLKELGKVVLSDGVPESELERAEGYRYLLAALAESIDVSLYRSIALT